MRSFITVILSSFLLSGCVSMMDDHSVLNQAGLEFQSKHYSQAFNHLMPLAKKGNAKAQYSVGYMYYYGLGVDESRKEAQYWINQSAAHGNLNAMKALEVEKRTHAGI